MPTPRRRQRLATGALLFPACLAALFAFMVSGCSILPKKKASSLPEPVLVAPKHAVIGRILSHDPADATAVIEFLPHYRPSPFLAGTSLIARKLDTLEPTARLVAAPYQNTRTLGAYVVSGQPAIDDEVVIAPEPEPDR